MSSEIDRNIRLCAMWCHLVILVGEPIIISTIAIFPKLLPQYPTLEQNLNVFFSFVFLSPLLGCIISMILVMSIWIRNRHRHSFIAESGKEVINFLCSISLYLLAIDSIVFASCGVGEIVRSDNLDSVLTFVSIGGIGIHFVLLLLVFFNTILASIKTAKGRIFHYPLNIRFLK